MTFNIDARGALPGMELLIRRGVEQAIDTAGVNEREIRKRGRA